MPTTRFFTLFRQHWDAGTGRPANKDVRYAGWTTKEFADTMRQCGAPISDDAARLWYRGTELKRNLPRATQKVAILKVFFPDRHADQAMEDAWQFARDNTAAPAAAESPNATDGWQLTENRATKGLAEIQFHDLETTNQQDHWKLQATPLFGVVELDDADIGLKDATLTVTTQYTIAQGSMLGDPARPHAHIKRIANGARITGPTDNHMRLEGTPVSEDHLAMIEPGEDGADSISLTLHAGRRSFHVTLPNDATETEDEKSIRDKKQRVLDLLLFNSATKDPQGRAILAKATRKRITPDS